MVLGRKALRALAEALALAEKVKPSQVAKRRVFARYGILGTSKDRALTAIMYSIFRYQGLLDRIIEAAGYSIESLEPRKLAALRVAAYALHYDRQGSTLRSEAKALLEDMGLPDAWEKLSKARIEPRDPVERVCFRYLVPPILVKKISLVLQGKELEEFLQKINEPPLLGLRVNTLKATVEEVLEELRREGVEAWRSRYVPVVVKFRGPYNYSDSKIIREGRAVPQDDASAAAAPILDPKPGEVVVDLCAAPGGKTTHIAELMRLEGEVHAFDVNPDRIKRLRWLLRVTGTEKIVKVYEMDGRRAPEILGPCSADKVLVDPPCSSTGALAKHPEARWRLTEESLKELVSLQKQLLETAFILARPGGRILYTTCSVLLDECEQVIEWLLNRHQGEVKLVEIHGPFSPGVLKGTMRAWPHRHETTGFFYALLEKKGRESLK